MTNGAKHFLLILSIATMIALANAFSAASMARGERSLVEWALQPDLTMTPTATNLFLTPIGATPTIATLTMTPKPTTTASTSVTATPVMATPTTIPPVTPTTTPTPTFVPTKPFARPLFVPLLMNQGTPTLRNGDFEAGNAFWSEYSSLRYRLILERSELQNVSPHGGEWAAWLGGKNNETSELFQRVIVPVDQPVLRYWYRIVADTDCGTDIASILIDEELLAQIHLCRVGNTDWNQSQLDLQHFSGQIVTITFRVDTDRNERHSNFFLDDIGWSASSEPVTNR